MASLLHIRSELSSAHRVLSNVGSDRIWDEVMSSGEDVVVESRRGGLSMYVYKDGGDTVYVEVFDRKTDEDVEVSFGGGVKGSNGVLNEQQFRWFVETHLGGGFEWGVL